MDKDNVINTKNVAKAKKATKRAYNRILRGRGTNKDQETVKIVINNYFSFMLELAEGSK